MTDPEACNGVHEQWKLLQDPKTVSTHETIQNRPKMQVFMTDPEACTGVHEPWKLLQDPKT